MHSVYIEKLKELFETHKGDQGIPQDVHLNIM